MILRPDKGARAGGRGDKDKEKDNDNGMCEWDDVATARV